MKNIKFRGKRTDNGEWIYGYYVVCGWTGKPKDYIVPEYASALYASEVDPKTVGQYIGKTDKNAIDCYDGDILEDERGKRYKVVWENDLIWLAKTLELHGNCYCPKSLIEHGAVVIGNIHKNPELLRGKE